MAKPQWLEPAFHTDRLRVFITELVPSDDNTPRLVFLATRTDIDRPMVAATAMVWMDVVDTYGAPWVDWLEVSGECRRQGFGTELIRGIERYLGTKVVCEPGSDDGKAFCAALENKPNG